MQNNIEIESNQIFPGLFLKDIQFLFKLSNLFCIHVDKEIDMKYICNKREISPTMLK
jgi:hypothetical protein